MSPIVARRNSPKIQSPRKESRRAGEAGPPMRGNHPGSLSFVFDEAGNNRVDELCVLLFVGRIDEVVREVG
jgi:hypothetical protein